jgi:hypothetical protein
MQLMQFNYFVENGLLVYDSGSGRLRIDFDRYPAVVESLLAKVLAIQMDGDKAAANAFIARWTAWTPELHAALAARMRGVETHRFHLFRYAALGE